MRWVLEVVQVLARGRVRTLTWRNQQFVFKGVYLGGRRVRSMSGRPSLCQQTANGETLPLRASFCNSSVVRE
jgi:hypothetical protein